MGTLERLCRIAVCVEMLEHLSLLECVHCTTVNIEKKNEGPCVATARAVLWPCWRGGEGRSGVGTRRGGSPGPHHSVSRGAGGTPPAAYLLRVDGSDRAVTPARRPASPPAGLTWALD